MHSKESIGYMDGEQFDGLLADDHLTAYDLAGQNFRKAANCQIESWLLQLKRAAEGLSPYKALKPSLYQIL